MILEKCPFEIKVSTIVIPVTEKYLTSLAPMLLKERRIIYLRRISPYVTSGIYT